jgi:hypothetical protein
MVSAADHRGDVGACLCTARRASLLPSLCARIVAAIPFIS